MYAWTAVFRAAVVVKVPGGEGGGTGQVVWQTYFNVLAQDMSFHLPGPSEFNSRQSATMIHTSLPAAAATSSAFCAADCTLANWRPAAWQSALASAHERASFMSV